ncbi:MAG: HAD-IIB family hydrolase [Bacilli bacterium]
MIKKYLQKLEKEGNIIVLTSGRAPRTMLHYYNYLNLHSPMISHNGAYAFNPYDKEFPIISYKLKKDELKKAYKDLIKTHVHSVMAENLDKFYVDEDDYFLFCFYNMKSVDYVKGDLSKLIDEDTYTFVMRLDDKSEKNLKFMENYVSHTFNDMQLTLWGEGDYCELTNKGINKGSSVDKIRKYYKIDAANVLVFGDSCNDIDLFKPFKNSFLMKNGSDIYAEYATYRTKKDNNHNGVIFEIKQFLKSNH